MKHVLRIVVGLVGLALATVSISSWSHAMTFEDVPANHPHADAIEALSEAGIISGTQDGTFQPDRFINRAEALKLILESSYKDVPEVASSRFPDVRKDVWFAKYAAYAKEQNLIGGYPDGTFKGGELINWAEVLKITLRTASLVNPDDYTADDYKAAFPELESDGWFMPYMMSAKEHGLLVLDHPASFPTRAEIAELLYRLRALSALELDTYDVEKSLNYEDIMKTLGLSSYKIADSMQQKEAESIVFAPLKEAKTLLLDTSPFLRGERPELYLPFLFMDPLKQKEAYINGANAIQTELDLLQEYWRQHPIENEEHQDLLFKLFRSLQTGNNETKNLAINSSESSEENTLRRIPFSMDRNRKELVKLYARSLSFYSQELLSQRDTLESLKNLSTAPAYQEMVQLFDTMALEIDRIEETIDLMDGETDSFLSLRKVMDGMDAIESLLKQVETKYRELVR